MNHSLASILNAKYTHYQVCFSVSKQDGASRKICGIVASFEQVDEA